MGLDSRLLAASCSLTAGAFIDTNPTDEPITCGLPSSSSMVAGSSAHTDLCWGT
jgi:hypothetical protein